ncbi:DUF354 domain-containing protein [Geomonas sp. RF6]|uniref:DUF354 domain-containing protein n=1 Tax=Geomonas sp. RF6 TaxID=2897342 RepID=UPI001E393720|nr:DUF354 domain-containing protein [Geomonas sp. RF6]UFS70698.1 DUF354 domain-containing protein [Geomonas sp. RF6]
MQESRFTIWIDLDNSPHVPFFAPLLKELRSRGFRIWLTASSRYQVADLASAHGLSPFLVNGGYYGKNKLLKIIGVGHRALMMLPHLRQISPVLALSHGSRAQMMAAKVVGIPVATIIDYEYVSISFASVDYLITPEIVPDSDSYRCNRHLKYRGLKEYVYTASFEPSGGVMAGLGIEEGKIVVTVRPPATDAHYHNDASEVLFRRVLDRVALEDNAVMVVVPRNESQRTRLLQQCRRLIEKGKVVIPAKSVSGLDLIWESDVVVSGGGTMNREAAALGVPVYSIFRGRIGAVDRYLAEAGRMTLLTSTSDVDTQMQVVKRKRPQVLPRHSDTLLDVADCIEQAVISVTSGNISGVCGAGQIS